MDGELIVDLGGVGHVNGVITVNLQKHVEPDIICDITASTAQLEQYIMRNEVDKFVCIHTLEHLFPGEYVPSMRYWREFLRPGGELLIVVPDMMGIWQDVTLGKIMVDVALSITYTLGYPLGSHKWGWADSTLRRDMHAAGYKNIREADYPKFWTYNYPGYEYTGAVGTYQVPNLCLLGENNV